MRHNGFLRMLPGRAWVFSAALILFFLSPSSATADPAARQKQSGIFLLTPDKSTHPERAKFALPQASHDGSMFFSLYHHSGRRVWEKELDLSPEQNLLSGSDIFGDRICLPLGIYFYQISHQRSGELQSAPLSDLLFQDVSATHLPADSTVAGFCEFFDANGDSFPDIIIGLNGITAPLRPRIVINDGTGHFTDETDLRLPSLELFVNDVAILDVGGDSDFDIYFACTTNQVPAIFQDKLYLNDGNGYFTDATATHLPVLPTISQNVDWGFINNDSFPDLVIAGLMDVIPPYHTSLYILINDGNGSFTDQSTAMLPLSKYGVMDGVLADVSSDALTDIVLANIQNVITDPMGNPIDTLSGQNAVFIQQPNGTFVDETVSRMPAINRWSKLMKIADIDNDGAPDLYAVNIGFAPPLFSNVLYMNNGGGFFQDETANRLPPETIPWNNDAEFRDFDADGNPDLFMINVVLGGAAPDVLYRNEGGIFSDISDQLPPIISFDVSCTSADIDGDSDFDLFISTDSGVAGTAGLPDLLYENLLLPVGIQPDPTVVEVFELNQNYPNPFNPTTVISWQLAVASEVELTIYNLLGQKIRTLVNARGPAGFYEIEWDGRDDGGKEVASGVYIYQIRADEFVRSRKMALIR